MLEFYMIFERKIKINSHILHSVCPKIPKFYITFARKIFFRDYFVCV